MFYENLQVFLKRNNMNLNKYSTGFRREYLGVEGKIKNSINLKRKRKGLVAENSVSDEPNMVSSYLIGIYYLIYEWENGIEFYLNKKS